MKKYVLAIAGIVILIGMFGVGKAFGQRAVGVGVCDWAEYTVFYSGNETLPSQLPPDSAQLKLTVEDISGTNIMFDQLWWANGTEVEGINSVDVETGQGNGTSMFIAKNLNESDIIYTSPPHSGAFGLDFGGLTINETISRQYLGNAVEVNHLNLTESESSPEGNQTISINFYWYRATGIIAEMSVSAVYQRNYGNTTWLEWKLVVTALEVLPQRYSVGVKAGDWVAYGDVSFEWSSNDTDQEPPSQLNMSWTTMKVLDVQNSNVTARVDTILKNGTEDELVGWVNVATGEGAMSMSFIPSNLTAGDRIPGRLTWPTMEPLKLFINGTITRSYAGAYRKVNFVNITYPIVYGNTTYGASKISLYWDQKTGFLCEEIMSYELSYSINSTNYYANMSISCRMTATNMWQAIFTVQDGYTFNITMNSNSTISNFNFSESSMHISFNVTGPMGKTGYCNVTIPRGLLQGSPWTVYLNGTDYTASCSITGNDTHTFIYIPYTCSTNMITIEGTWAIPEFPSTVIILAFMITTLLATIAYKRKKRILRQTTPL
jgi:hypothetical protein